MMISYFDTSVLLAILLDQDKQEEAFGYWQNSTRVSSILLRIESVIALRRTYENNKNNLPNDWLNKKIKIMDEYLATVNYLLVNEKIERTVYSQNELAQCRSLDAIHIATALQFREISNNEAMNLYTFDKTMHGLAEYFKFKTNFL